MNFKKTKLPNGLRVITAPVSSPTVIVLVAVETGSNYESKEENGLSHFLEHMCFKGTKNRPKTSDVVRDLDALGAKNNAFTSEEFTGYYAKASKKHFSKLFEIISDLYLNPTLPEKDIEIERGVILEEMRMYEDLPQRKVLEILPKLLYGNVPAGRLIIGTEGNIKNFSRDNFVNYRNKHYTAEKTFVIVAGDVTEQEVMQEFEKHFKSIPEGKNLSKDAVRATQSAPQLLIHDKDTDQTHLAFGFHTDDASGDRVSANNLLAEVLAGGMSSRLFTKLRDDLGLCYYVRSEPYLYTDHGVFTISTGVNLSRTTEAIKAILKECKKLAKEPVPDDELSRAKEHYVGHLYMDLETTDSIAEYYLEQEITTGKLKDPGEEEEKIRSLSAKDIQDTAKQIFKNENLNLAVVGKISDKGALQEALSFK